MTIVKINELPKLRKKNPHKKLIYCSGCFDLTHAGHVLFFEDCKKFGDILVIGVGADYAIKLYKGNNRPIFNENIRAKIVDSLKPVDFVFLDSNYKKEDPYFGIEFVLNFLRPDVYIINEDAYGIEKRREIAKKYKIKIKILKRWCPEEYDNISTTKIIEKIKSF